MGKSMNITQTYLSNKEIWPVSSISAYSVKGVSTSTTLKAAVGANTLCRIYSLESERQI